jgi:hypothetical protein
MLAFLLTPLATEARRGSAFGELHGGEIEFCVTLANEAMLTKSLAVVRRRPMAPDTFLKFITYLSTDVLRSTVPTIASGIVPVRFADESEDRLFTLYVRRSGSLGAFFQMDQFPSHL